jgi:hypothetical protein
LRVGKLDEKHFRFAEVIANSDDKNSFANLRGIDGCAATWTRRWMMPIATSKECRDNNCCEGADGGEALRGKERLPPARLAFGKTRRDLRPDAPAVVFARVGNGNGVHGGENGFDFFERGAAFGTSAQMLLHALAIRVVPIVKCN